MAATRTTAPAKSSTPSPTRPQASTAKTPNSTQSTTKRKRNADEEDDAHTTPAKSARRRKTNEQVILPDSADVIDLTASSPPTTPTKKTKSPKKRSPGELSLERRARVFRKHAPKSILDRLARARTQKYDMEASLTSLVLFRWSANAGDSARMYVVGHSVAWDEDVPEVEFSVVGSTGNIYTTVIGKVPSCNCPDALKGNQCKHILYVLVNALKAPEYLQYQLAFLSSELRDIYHASPLGRQQLNPAVDDGKRKSVEGDCPICFMEFEPDTEDIVWCRAACGNNIHKKCFQQWAATQNAQGVRCVYCRSVWEADSTNLDLDQLSRTGHVNHEGYLNVARQLGMSGERGTRPSLYLLLFALCRSGYRGGSSYYYGWGRNRRSYW
ncbi:RING finger protein [Aspergillus clavatus NRRL 1]|uniref:RING finger domain protein (Znf1), putative n=1 Tax=Aspergillus clavatus (strain ATCC 1007 / CBS 513.65 / DSM 816 / NCTC 3887 / NRRL 1 / QM 1276 / 107) TaxID=344612 RepID=A1CGW3_ASPCL|nr:RING finger domain protein (Znf1), putative [Aspergillus clavatus NRRL 1]EAW10118.1 RING finger domain protein (Znf1), putative [Aspergillus clavatus NRRL 1]